MIGNPFKRMGRWIAMKLLVAHGNKTCPECGHSNWAHGKAGCCIALQSEQSAGSKDDSGECPCKRGKTNEQIIFFGDGIHVNKVEAYDI
jgi:RNA polymerase subunit RPABC4/transcription elongation factor Spt4